MATTSAEQHFEGLDEASLRRRKRLIGTAVIAVAVLLYLFARSTLPSQRAEFIGHWQAGGASRAYLDIRPDGTYTSRFRLDAYDGRLNSWVVSDGKWRASHRALYLTPKAMKPEGILPNMSTFKELYDNTLNREQRLHFNWNTTDSINAQEVEGEPFTRGTIAP